MFNPFSYIAYQFQGDEKRTAFLMDCTRRDPFYAKILDDLVAFGFRVDYPWFGRNGQYAPNVLDVLDENFYEDFARSVRLGDVRVRFAFAPWLGRADNLHAWLHELTHFYQDMYGLFLEPLCIAGKPVIAPDEESFVAAYLFCEAMAEVEAIRVSWRLKEKEDGTDLAWAGALYSEWEELAEMYRHAVTEVDEIHASMVIYDHWQNMPQKLYYAARAKLHYDDMIAHLSDGQEVVRNTVPLRDVVAMLPEGLRPVYAPKNGKVPPRGDVQVGSAAYLWKTSACFSS